MSGQLSPEEIELFAKLHGGLMVYVNQQCGIVPDVSDFGGLSPETRLQVRDALLEQPGLIGRFVADNPATLSDKELEIIRAWQDYVAGRFFVFRFLKKQTIFRRRCVPRRAKSISANTRCGRRHDMRTTDAFAPARRARRR